MGEHGFEEGDVLFNLVGVRNTRHVHQRRRRLLEVVDVDAVGRVGDDVVDAGGGPLRKEVSYGISQENCGREVDNLFFAGVLRRPGPLTSNAGVTL